MAHALAPDAAAGEEMEGPGALVESAAVRPRPQSFWLLRLYPALGQPEFRLLWTGMLPATLAWQMAQVATPYAAFRMSDSATVLGLVAASSSLPMLVLALVGGVVADRVSRRRVLLGTQSVLCLSAGVLAVLSLLDLLEVWHLIAVGLMQGTAFSFNQPARQAYIADLVGRPLLRNAVALNNAGMNCCRIVGPAIAGVLLSLQGIGVSGVFVSMAVLYALVVASLFRLPNVPVVADPSRRRGGFTELQEGLRYVWRSPTLLSLLGVAFLTIVAGLPYQTLMPVVADRLYEAGAAGLGTLMAAVGVGALVGSLGVAALTGGSRAAGVQIVFGIGFGLALVLAGLIPIFPAAVVAFAVVGCLSASYTALNNTLVMGNTDPSLYGRVMSIYMLTYAAVPLGTLPLAWLAEQLGVRVALVAAGSIVAAGVGTVALMYPPFRRVR